MNLLRDDRPDDGRMRILVVTRMWPSATRVFRDGFLPLEVDAIRRSGIRCDVLVAQGPHGPLAYAQLARAVRRLVKTDSYDLVHAHYGLTGLAAGVHNACPLVVTLHGCDIMGDIDSEGRTTTRGRMEQVLSSLAVLRASETIAVGPHMARYVRGRTAQVIPVAIDQTLFCPVDRGTARAELGLDPDRRYVLFIADPSRLVKRHWLAKEAVEQVRLRCPDTQLLTVYHRELSEIPKWMNAADVLIITSAREGGPLIHKEAMACNLPVVSVDVGDVPVYLDGVTHSYVVGDTAGELASALEKVLVTRPRSDGREHLGALVPDAIAERLASLYRETVSAARARDERDVPVA